MTEKNSTIGLEYKPTSIFLVLALILIVGCGSNKSPLSPEAQVAKNEISPILSKMREALAPLVARGSISGLDKALEGFSNTTAGICIDCPYKSAVLNKDGLLLTTFPKNEVVGRNFSSYRLISEALTKQKITQSQVFMADGTKMYFISIPLINDKQVAGVAVLALTPKDIFNKWHLSEKEFVAIDFNTP